MPVAGEQPHASGITARHQPVAVMLDFVNPVRAGRRSVGCRWEAGFDEAGRQQTGTRQHGKNEIPCCMYVAERKRHPQVFDNAWYRFVSFATRASWSAAEEISLCGNFSSDDSETPELNLRALFERKFPKSGKCGGIRSGASTEFLIDNIKRDQNLPYKALK
jgi:hypothetical protein